MSVLSDTEIKKLVYEQGMINPFVDHQVSHEGMLSRKCISYGLSSYGYDIRCTNDFKLFTNVLSSLIDPKLPSQSCFVDRTADYIIIPPNSFALTSSVEYFYIPRDVVAVCLGKSTYARCGIVVNITPLEPEWVGQVTIEISNTTSLPVMVYGNEGIAQVLFFRGDVPCAVSYADKKGKYQDQRGITLAKV
jgi:dCTP deaminase